MKRTNHVKRTTTQLVRWFVVCGCIGVLTAIATYGLGAVPFARPFVVRAMPILCPEMILGLGEPISTGAILLLVGWVSATNFVLYGLVGLLVYAVRAWLRSTPSMEKPGPNHLGDAGASSGPPAPLTDR